MVKIYVKWIRQSKMAVDDVPLKWRRAVERMLNHED